VLSERTRYEKEYPVGLYGLLPGTFKSCGRLLERLGASKAVRHVDKLGPDQLVNVKDQDYAIHKDATLTFL